LKKMDWIDLYFWERAKIYLNFWSDIAGLFRKIY
jgi:hypothetical protein